MRSKIEQNMKSVLCAAVAVSGIGLIGADPNINGAGASFPAPVYRVWTYSYRKATGTRVNYQSVGSGAGIRQIKARTVDFGGSDKPLKKADQDKAKLIQFPMLMGGVVVVANIPGVKDCQLKLSSKVLGDIFLGKIKKWNDPQVRADNPGMNLPNMNITVVHRSDGSGTTWIFTNYLSKISKAWSSKVGCGKAVKWPCGLGGQKNPGVANNVKRVNGAIGYVEYTYATSAKIPMIQLRNKSGNFVKPDMKSFQAAGANADWDNAPGFYMVLTDQPGKDSWPITGVTYILIHNDIKMSKVEAMIRYFKWCYTEGATSATKLGYVPIPDNVVAKVKGLWKKTFKGLK